MAPGAGDAGATSMDSACTWATFWKTGKIPSSVLITTVRAGRIITTGRPRNISGRAGSICSPASCQPDAVAARPYSAPIRPGAVMPHSNGLITADDDGTLYISKNGWPYMVFCHEWVREVDGKICAVPLMDDLRATACTAVTLFTAKQAKWSRSASTSAA